MTRQQERRQLWEERIAAYRSSGQRVREWCAANDVKPERMWYWLRQVKTGLPEVESTWLQAVVDFGTVPPEQTVLVVRVGKAAIEIRPGFHPDLLSQVVQTRSSVC